MHASFPRLSNCSSAKSANLTENVNPKASWNRKLFMVQSRKHSFKTTTSTTTTSRTRMYAQQVRSHVVFKTLGDLCLAVVLTYRLYNRYDSRLCSPIIYVPSSIRGYAFIISILIHRVSSTDRGKNNACE